MVAEKEALSIFVEKFMAKHPGNVGNPWADMNEPICSCSNETETCSTSLVCSLIQLASFVLEISKGGAIFLFHCSSDM